MKYFKVCMSCLVTINQHQITVNVVKSLKY